MRARSERIGHPVVVGDLSEAAGSRLQRAPYVCLALTLCLYLVIIGSLARNPQGSPHTSNLLAVVAVLMILADVALVYLEPRITRAVNETLARRWALAMFPFFAGYGSTALGAQEWVYGAGLVISVVLLVHTVGAIRRSARAG